MRADLKRLEKIQTSFRTELEDVQSDIALTEKTINSFDKDIHEHGLAINVLESKVPTLISTSFEERLDPLQANIDHEMSTIKGYLETLNDKVIELKQQALTQQPGLTPSQQALLINLGATSTALKDDMLRLQDRIAAETNQRKDDVSELRMQALQDRKSSLHSDLTAAQSPTLATLVQNTSSLKQDLDHLQAFAAGEKDRRDHEIRSIREQLATKQETAVAERAMDVIKLGVRNLQDQYNNITTDDLHQRMAGWFLEQYPSDTANFLRRISGVEQELRRLHGHWQQVSWISLYAEPLRMLAQTGPPTNPSASNSELQKISARAKEAVDDVRVARERCEAAERRVTEHEAGVQALRTQLTDLANEERNARAEFVTKASAEHQQRVAAEAKMKASIHQLEKMMKEKTDAAMASITTTIVRVEDVEKVIKDIQMASVQLPRRARSGHQYLHPSQ
jgi:predicted  nucleic acid-binding Zn-ribbon protein